MKKLMARLKIRLRLEATAFVLDKFDAETIAGYIVQYGDKFYGDRRAKFMELIYLKLLEVVSAVNRRRTR